MNLPIYHWWTLNLIEFLSLSIYVCSGDIFGIAYKPFIKKKEEYSLPKLSAFEDEFAFEEELRLPAQIKKTIEGDEFDFEESAGPKKSVEKLVPIHKPVGNAEKIKKAAEEEAKFIAVLKDENKMLLQKQSVVPPPSSAESSSTQDTKSSITVSARQSLDEIVSIYSSGLGDQEVRLLDMKSGDESARRRSSFNQHNRGVSTIDEGDEDEAEKEEHEQEQREIIALDTEQNLREKLEAEWDTVDASNAGLTLNGHANTDSEFSEMSYAETLTYLR